MAKVLFGQGVADMRGSIGGTTFSRSKSGATARNRSKPVTGPPTGPQDFVRNRFASIQAFFATLAPEKLDSWAAHAESLQFQNSLGQSYAPTPKQAFTAIKANQVIAGLDLDIDVPPGTTVPMIDLSAVTSQAQVAAGPPTVLQTLSYVGIDAGVAAGNFVVFQATVPISAQLRNYKKLCRQIAVYEQGDIDGDHSDDYNTLYGGGGSTPVTIGQTIGARFRAIDPTSGLSSAWYYVNTLTEATGP